MKDFLRRGTVALAALVLAGSGAVTPALAVKNSDTALSAQAVNLYLSNDGKDDGLTLILSRTQRTALIEAVTATLTADEKAMIDNKSADMIIRCNAGKLSGVRTADKVALDAVLSKKEVTAYMIAELRLSKQIGNGTPVAIKALDRPIDFTLTIPTGALGDSTPYTISRVTEKSEVILMGDKDEVPNTITFSTDTMGEFAIIEGMGMMPESKPTEPLKIEAAPALPTEPQKTEAAPASPTEPPKIEAAPIPSSVPVDTAKGSNPKAGGVPELYLPRSAMASAIPVAATVPVTNKGDSTMQKGMLSISIMMTAIMVGSSIDYENSGEADSASDEEFTETME